MNKEFATWKGKLLSIGGQLALIKASLSKLSLYYMSLFPIPAGVMEKFIGIFIWTGHDGKISWHYATDCVIEDGTSETTRWAGHWIHLE